MGHLQQFPKSFFCKSDHTLLNRNNFQNLFLWHHHHQRRRIPEHHHHHISSLPRTQTRIIHFHLNNPHHSLPFRRHTFLPMSAASTPNSTPPHSSTSDANSVTYRVVVKGRVQGVFFRDWTVQNATELGLTGWVRNRKDGSVEALFSGPTDKVQEMQQRCRNGPPAAIVTGFEAAPSTEDPGSGFERRRTV